MTHRDEVTREVSEEHTRRWLTWLAGLADEGGPEHQQPVVALDDGNGHHDPTVDELTEAK